jgi:KDO2-lipid IV(A) lauroyltransferase
VGGRARSPPPGSLTDPTLTAYQLAAAVARAMPAPAAGLTARLVGLGFAQVSAGRRQQVERNLRRIYGSGLHGLALRRAVAATFESYARYWAESLRLPGTSPELLDAGMSYRGLNNVDEGLAAGRGVILALPHLGGWEWAGFWLAEVQRKNVSVVVETLNPPELFEWFAELRRAFGMNIIPLDADAGTAVVRALRANHVVCLLCDRDIGGGGVEVEFFGERTLLPGGPATLALRTGAPVLPVAVYFRPHDHLGMVCPPIPAVREGRLRDDVARVTQLLAHELERLIRAAPEQWHLLQPNWPSDPGWGESHSAG